MISLNIFTKCPSTGEPKSRMQELLDEDGRCNLTRVMLDFILSETINLNTDIKKTLWVFPNCSDKWIRNISNKYLISLKSQIGRTLSARMIHCLLSETKKSEKVILVGSDIPSLSKNNIIKSINLLDHNDIVLGPSYDGGFYLIGIKDNVTCQQLLEYGSLSCYSGIKSYFLNLNKKVSILDKLKDIDKPMDLLII